MRNGCQVSIRIFEMDTKKESVTIIEKRREYISKSLLHIIQKCRSKTKTISISYAQALTSSLIKCEIKLKKPVYAKSPRLVVWWHSQFICPCYMETWSCRRIVHICTPVVMPEIFYYHIYHHCSIEPYQLLEVQMVF